jgi:hypothetical protein
VPDRGESARSADFFRCAEYHEAEGITHTLAAGDSFSAAVIVREVPGGNGERDAVSAYGYPGAVRAELLDPDGVDWRGTGLVSAFLRDRVGDQPALAGGTLRSKVQIADPSRPLRVREQHRRHIRRNARAGFQARVIAGPRTSAEERHAFEELYRQTMVRTGASERYFFSGRWFELVLSTPLAWLLLVDSPEREPAAGAIAVESDGLLHYFLGGTTDERLRESPFKNVVEAMIDLAAERSLPLSLGGGVTPGDSLERFKQGFANRTAPFFTHELVCDPQAYARLSSGRADSGFFPLYRA